MPKDDSGRKTTKQKPWYAPKDDTRLRNHGSEWQAKRDNWEKFSPEKFQPVVQPTNEQNPQQEPGPVYDTYSRTYGKTSQRSRGDTAHYLLDVTGAPKLDEGGILLSASDKLAQEKEKEDSLPIYKEDVLENGHKSVWGSWWCNGRWGYDCCRQIEKDAQCKLAAST